MEAKHEQKAASVTSVRVQGDVMWIPCSERQPEEPGCYLGAIDWDEGATCERWFDGSEWWNCNLDPENAGFHEDIVWTVPVTHWAETPRYQAAT